MVGWVDSKLRSAQLKFAWKHIMCLYLSSVQIVVDIKHTPTKTNNLNIKPLNVNVQNVSSIYL